MRKFEKVSMAYPPKEYYPLSNDIREQLLVKESKEDIDEFFNQIELCKELNICMECGQGVIFNNENRAEHIKEYSISALCSKCQDKIFGI